ncbi:MAG: hypothetical protein AMJ56_09350 [Anaerolineae bacterium SG8_19]|jgi:uncharacterized membrane protein YphA (DoxX/SURF4 family)|nr:MAG: hypothetical protein AMJ56_09350 [Anaerolineae bacterium SG8_19]
MFAQKISAGFDRVDTTIVKWMARHGLTLLRISVGIVFLWFGALKLIPEASPAESLIQQSLPFLPMEQFLPVLAIWEMIIGLGFITGKFMRLTILLMIFQMIGAASPIVLNPTAVFVKFPFVLTLEGQYIIKNAVLVSAAFVIGATVRGGELSADPVQGNLKTEQIAL